MFKVKRRKKMKKISLLFVVSLLVSATCFGETNKASVSGTTSWSWTVNASRLSRCLELNSAQYDEVTMACEYFADKLLKAANSKKEDLRSALVKKAVLGNLKLMREALNTEQYKKYISLLNLTLQNKGLNVYLN